MISHIRYSEQQYRDAAECLEGITAFLHRGWWVSSLIRAGRSYVVTFGIEDEDIDAAAGGS